MLFLDFVFMLFALYLITQILLPLIFPKQLKLNWLFKKREDVQKLQDEKDRVKSTATEMYSLNEQQIQEAKKNKQSLKKLTK